MKPQYLHDPALLRLREQHADLEPLMQRGIFTDAGTGRDYFTGYDYRTLYDWDQYFEGLVQVYMGWPSDYMKNGVLIFLDNQKESGMVPRSGPGDVCTKDEHTKPFLAQIALLVHRAYGELEWIASEPYFTRLRKYLDFWLVGMDANRNGLSEWMSAPHTGMDNQHERAGYWGDRFCEGVDLNCYLVRECRAFSDLAELAGQTKLSCLYRQKADERAEAVRREMWDEQDGFFYDRNARTGEGLLSPHAGFAANMNWGQKPTHLRVKCVSSFAPLWAGVATDEQAKRLICDHLLNAAEFWSPWPVAAMARNERWYSPDPLPTDMGCNWRASTWMPTNYMIYHGLRKYGYGQIASVLASRTLEMVERAGNREWYSSQTGEGCGGNPFWGWSLLAHFLSYEEQQADRELLAS